MEEAFRLLLLQPLRAFHEQQQQQQQQVVLLVDALDEADPPELLRATASTASSGDGGEGSAAQQAPPACPTVCGNSALQLLVSQLSQLPPCVRFIVTTRPDAAAGQVLPCLERTFGGGRGGGVTHLRPADMRKGSSSSGGSGGSNGVLLYHTAAAALADEVAKPSRAAVPMPPPPPQLPATASVPQLSDVLDLYGKVFDAARARYGATPPLPLPDTADSGPVPGSAAAGSSSSSPRVSDLLSVLLAAREPLSASFLQQLGLGPAVCLQLPGWGRLFFNDEHHLYTAHRTLDEWLLRSGSSRRGGGSGGSSSSGGGKDPFEVQLGNGHQVIGLYLANNVWQGGAGIADGANTTTATGGGTAAAALPYMVPYTLKYVVSHLVAAVEWQAVAFAAAADGVDISDLDPHVAYGPAAVCLDKLLTDFGFLTAVLGAGHGPALVGTLAGLSAHTRHSYDLLRYAQSLRHASIGASKVYLPASLQRVTGRAGRNSGPPHVLSSLPLPALLPPAPRQPSLALSPPQVAAGGAVQPGRQVPRGGGPTRAGHGAGGLRPARRGGARRRPALGRPPCAA